MPRISVLMPVYNTRPEHLRDAMDSILSQTFTDFEFLILNDCSTDPQVETVVKSYTDPRIVYAVNERNLGISGARKRLLDMAQGEYLAVMDHDDIALPTRFEKQVAFLDAHPEIGIVGSRVENMGTGKTEPRPEKDIDIKKMLMINCNLSHPSCMIRRSVLEKNNIRYEALYSPAEDYALFARLIPVTQFAIIQEPLLRYREWGGNTSNKQSHRMSSATQGIYAFMRRDNPEIWAMAQYHQKTGECIKILGITVMTVVHTFQYDEWRLFDAIPILKIKKRPTGLRNLP